MMINGANAVIHPPLQQNVDEGVERVVESIYRMKILADEFDRLERMSFEDLAYPAIFDQTFNRFFDLWEHESVIYTLLHLRKKKMVPSVPKMCISHCNVPRSVSHFLSPPLTTYSKKRSANLLRDVMRDADFDLLAPRWQVIRETTPTR